MKENIGVVMLAGGVGKRAKKRVPKQLLLVGGKPMLVHSLEKIDTLEQVVEVVIPCAEEANEKTRYVLDAWGFEEPKYLLVPGGSTRQESVFNGIKALSECDYVIIHEAARPFVTQRDFQNLIEAEESNVLLGVPIPFTVAESDDAGYISGMLDRRTLVNVQLPQIFEYHAIYEAHEKAYAQGLIYTEDATLLFDQCGIASKVIEGGETNIKITYPSDLTIAEAIYRNYIAGGTDE